MDIGRAVVRQRFAERSEVRVLTGTPDEVGAQVEEILKADVCVRTADGDPIWTSAIDSTGEHMAVLVWCIKGE